MTTPSESYSDRLKEKRRLYYLANKERSLAYSSEYQKGHKKENVERHKRWREKNPDSAKAIHRSIALKWRYGITTAERDALFLEQNSRCPICNTAEPRGKRPWHVDHCHSSGKVRGVLCCTCNTLLGMARDNVEVLKSAIAYLAR